MSGARLARAATLFRGVSGHSYVLNVLALSGTLGLAFGHPGVAMAAWPVGLLLLVAFTYPGVTRFWAAAEPAGMFVLARAVVLAGVALVAPEDTTARLALILLAVALLAESPLRALSASDFPVVSRLPGLAHRRPTWVSPGTSFVANTLVLALAAAAALAERRADSVLLAAGALTLAVTVVAGIALVLRVRDRQRVEAGLHRALSEHGPRFVLHWDAPAGTAYQVAMWLPYLERLGERFVVLVRSSANFDEVVRLTDAPVVLRKGLTDLDSVVTPSMKVAFYVNTATKNCHYVRYTQMTHIQLNHGDSDKAPSFNPVFRMYDKNFVAGQAAIDRFATHGVSMPQEMFAIVGRPQVEHVAVATAPISTVGAPTVLYAPTWAGFYADSNYCSLGTGVAMVQTLLDRGARVVFRPHPYARKHARYAAACDEIIALLARDRETTGRDHLFGTRAEREMSVVDCFNASDAMIADVSSVVPDYLFSEKPFAMVAVSRPAATFAAEFPIAEAAYVVDGHKGRLQGFGDVLDQMLGSDPLATTRRERKVYYLGDIPAATYAQRFLDEARAFL
ncbi:glycosyl transferase [Flavimobilis marinus]|uniref:CDP-Glycerol:Poly(Glycerophosphate) glycerophosphotransferase n=1 Tax=Flavimobilis marinus TaxID=285351 RepID=A0A1I2HFT9_9MICO|nr:CDP-glycerol glycerophosphotransferase family protein [Flavimobilis marinus]GHG57430.1 glycosyl transferase [Flavimobilis marinus]SFF29135.1 CDP-Glycerol:Poly(glycerophosphate) glycerophosphotransferase [Flavimobilis marinus]